MRAAGMRTAPMTETTMPTHGRVRARRGVQGDTPDGGAGDAPDPSREEHHAEAFVAHPRVGSQRGERGADEADEEAEDAEAEGVRHRLRQRDGVGARPAANPPRRRLH